MLVIRLWLFPFVIYFIGVSSTGRRGGRTTRKCDYDLEVLWTRELGHSPFAAPPLIADVDGDGQMDVVAAPFSEEVTVVRGSDGMTLPGSKWPYYLVDITIHASPLLFDMSGDGMPEILVVTSDGEFLYFSADGLLLEGYSFQLPGLLVDREWHQKMLTAEQEQIHNFILDEPPVEGQVKEGYVVVDPHVLATPVLADLNGDQIAEELVIPVSYYFDLDYYSLAENADKRQELSLPEMENYLVSAVVTFNLTASKIIHVTHLELTKVMAEYPGYLLYSPTVIDLDSNGTDPEIIIGTSAGQIHALDTKGQQRKHFPIPSDTLHGQLLVADVNQDGLLEIVAMDTSGNVMCFSREGKVLWETLVTGTVTAGMRLADVDGDEQVDVVFSTNDGHVWVLNGRTGVVPNRWPFRVVKGVNAVPTLMQASHFHSVDVVVLGDDEHLHIVPGDSQCLHAANMGESSLVPVLTHDLVPRVPGLELLVATKDGTLLCLGRTNRSWDGENHKRKAVLDGWAAETRGHNGFYYSDSKMGVVIDCQGGVLDLTGSWTTIYFEILDSIPGQEETGPYRVGVYLGQRLLGYDIYSRPGRYHVTLHSPAIPTEGRLKVMITNHHGQVFEDHIAVRFNMLFLHDMQWLLLCPFIVMGIILLLLHGYPAVDLLPLTQTDKGR